MFHLIFIFKEGMTMSQISIWLGDDSRCSFSLEWKITALFVFWFHKLIIKSEKLSTLLSLFYEPYYASWGSVVIHKDTRQDNLQTNWNISTNNIKTTKNILVLQHSMKILKLFKLTISSCHISWCFHVLTLLKNIINFFLFI